jgi:uncharacterized protein (DUF885 family)
MSESTARGRLAALSERFWDGFVAANPTFGTIVGDRRFDDRLEDLTPTARAAESARLATVASEARAIEHAALDERDRVTRQALIDEAEGDLALLAAELDDFTVDPLEGPQVHLLNLEAFQTVETPDLGQAMLARWRAMAPYLDAASDNLRRGLAAGRVGVRSPIERTIDQLASLTATPIPASPLLRPLSQPHPGWPAGAWSAFETDLTSAVRDAVLPAFERYGRALAEEILPGARPDDRPGLAHVPGGADAYRWLIRHHTTLDLDPATIHETGLHEIERTDEALMELGERVIGTRDLTAIQAALRSDPALHFRTREEILDVAVRSVERAVAAIPEWFGRMPVAECEVVEMAEHEARHSTVAYYVGPAQAGARPGRFYLNTSDPTSRPRYDAETLAFHEAVPGHHLQTAIAQEMTDLPTFRRLLGSSAYSEGWALYAEVLADEVGLLSGDLDRLGRISSQAWRAARLVVDTGLHAFGWSRDAAIAYLREHTALADGNIVNEVDRYIVWPGQALAYLVGQLAILGRRERAMTELGDRFDRRAFHDAVLGAGAVSLGTLDAVVAAWIEAHRSPS